MMQIADSYFFGIDAFRDAKDFVSIIAMHVAVQAATRRAGEAYLGERASVNYSETWDAECHGQQFTARASTLRSRPNSYILKCSKFA